MSEQAIDAIGREQPDDWQLRPETHAARLPASAGVLKRILLAPELKQTMEEFNRSDRKAVVAQAYYKRLAQIASIASFLAVVIGGILLTRPFAQSLALTAAIVAQCVLLGASFLASLIVIYAKPFAAWMRTRAEAENARIALFDQVMAGREQPQPGELPLLPLQLEYLRRYQLDVQRKYYGERGRQHARAVKRAGYVRIAALVLIVLAAAPLLWGLRDYPWTPAVLQQVLADTPSKIEFAQRLFLCLGLIGGALQGLLASYSLLSNNERNAVRYRDTSANLEDLAGGPLAEARTAADAADRERVLGFVALVHQQISSEHREWIALRALAPELSLDRLRAVGLPKLS